MSPNDLLEIRKKFLTNAPAGTQRLDRPVSPWEAARQRSAPHGTAPAPSRRAGWSDGGTGRPGWCGALGVRDWRRWCAAGRSASCAWERPRWPPEEERRGSVSNKIKVKRRQQHTQTYLDSLFRVKDVLVFIQANNVVRYNAQHSGIIGALLSQLMIDVVGLFGPAKPMQYVALLGPTKWKID